MDAIQMLIEDHQRVNQLFDQFQAASGAQEKERIAKLVFKELSVHSLLEKELFYPTVALNDPQEKELIDHSYHDHAEVEERIGLLKNMQPGDAQYETVFKELMSHVLEHVEEEEGQLFPQARQRLGDKMDALGRKMEQRQQELISAPV